MAGDTASPRSRCVAILAPARKHLWPVVRDDVYQEFTYVSHAVHPGPLPPDAGSDIFASRSGCSRIGTGYVVGALPTVCCLPAVARRVRVMGHPVTSPGGA